MSDLVVEGLCKQFVAARDALGRPKRLVHAVRGVGFVVPTGKTVGLVGESGAGKSTIGRLVLRLEEADQGAIRLGETDVRALSRSDLRKFRARARMIFQDPFSSLNPKMVMADAIGEVLRAHTDLKHEQRRDYAAELLQRVGLNTKYLDSFPYEMSGGQLQRVAVARAIATNPELIVCDEPVAALDMSIRATVINLLRDIQHERNLGYLFISHDLSLVELIADLVVVLYAGEVVESGPADKLFAKPRHPYTKALLAAVPQPDPSQRDRRLAPPRIAAAAAAPTGCSYARVCPSAMDVCFLETPPATVIDDVVVVCHLEQTTGVTIAKPPAPLESERCSVEEASQLR